MKYALAWLRAAAVVGLGPLPCFGSDVLIDFEGLPFTQAAGGDVVPNPDSVLTDDFANLGVVFGLQNVSAGVAVVRDTLAPSSGLNTVAGLDANGIIPGSAAGGADVGDIYFSFVVPGTTTPGKTDFVSFTIGDGGGDLDEFNIRAYDVGDTEIFNMDAAGVSRFAFAIAAAGIHRVEIDFLGDFGYSMDDLCFDNPVSAECFLVIGPGPGLTAFDPVGQHTFWPQVAQVDSFQDVLLDDLGEVLLPTPEPSTFGRASLVGDFGEPVPVMSFAAQILMWNPQVFPQYPEQYTAPVFVTVFSNGHFIVRSYGSGTGMEMRVERAVNSAGQPVLRFPFTIPGI